MGLRCRDTLSAVDEIYISFKENSNSHRLLEYITVSRRLPILIHILIDIDTTTAMSQSVFQPIGALYLCMPRMQYVSPRDYCGCCMAAECIETLHTYLIWYL